MGLHEHVNAHPRRAGKPRSLKSWKIPCCGLLVDKPVSKCRPVHLCTRVVEDIFPTRIHWTTVALFNTVTIDWVRLPAPWVFWRLFLVLRPNTHQHIRTSKCDLSAIADDKAATVDSTHMVKARAAGGCAVVIPVTCGHVVGAIFGLCDCPSWVGAVRESVNYRNTQAVRNP